MKSDRSAHEDGRENWVSERERRNPEQRIARAASGVVSGAALSGGDDGLLMKVPNARAAERDWDGADRGKALVVQLPSIVFCVLTSEALQEMSRGTAVAEFNARIDISFRAII